MELLRPGFSHSKAEARARGTIAEVLAPLGLHPETRPLPIRAGGRIIAEADVAVTAVRLDYEIDGPHHQLLRQRRRDGHRDELLDGIDWAVSRHPVAQVDEDLEAFGRTALLVAERRLDALSSRAAT